MSQPVKEKLREKLRERRETTEEEESSPEPDLAPREPESPEPQPGPSSGSLAASSQRDLEALELWRAHMRSEETLASNDVPGAAMVNFSPQPATRCITFSSEKWSNDVFPELVDHQDSPAKMYRRRKAPDSTLPDPVERLTVGISSAKIYRSPKKSQAATQPESHQQRDWAPRAGPLDLSRSPAKLCRSPSPRTVSPYHRPNVQQQAGGGETAAVRSDFPSALAIGGGPDSPAKIIYKSPRKSSPVKQCAARDRAVSVMVNGQPLQLGPDDSPESPVQSPDTSGMPPETGDSPDPEPEGNPDQSFDDDDAPVSPGEAE